MKLCSTLVLLLAVLHASANPWEQAFSNPALFPVIRKTPPQHPALTLIDHGKANFALVRDGSKEEKLWPNRRSSESAARLLQEGFQKCFGAEVSIFNSLEEAAQHPSLPYVFYVGESQATKKLGLDVTAMPKGGFEIKTFAKGVALVGYDGSQIPGFYENMPGSGVSISGTKHGAVDFLERILGCRFYYPGPLGEIYPRQQSLVLPPMHYGDYPRMQSRDNYHHMSSAFNKRDLWEPLLGAYGDVNRFASLWRLERGSMFIANHSPQPNQWLKAHPDKKDLLFYRAPNGYQYYTPSDGHGGKYLDVTNLKLADLLVQDWKKFFASNGKDHAPWTWDCPNRDYVSFGQADSSVPLADMETKPIVQQLGLITPAHKKTEAGAYSDIYARFFQYLGNALAKELPHVRLGLIPYSDYTQPPKLAAYRNLPDNIDLRVCLMQLPGRVRNPDIVRDYRTLLKGWYEAQNNRPIHSLWLYNSPNNPFARCMNPRFIREVPKAFAPYFSGDDMIYGFWFEMEWYYYYSNYIGMRSLWNTDISPEAILDEHWPMMYGKAAPKVKAFHDLLLHCYLTYYVPSREATVLYPYPELEKLTALARQIREAVPPDSLEGRRIRLFLAPWKKAIESMQSQLTYERQVYKVSRIAGTRPTHAEWAVAPAIAMMHPMGGRTQPAFPTEAKLLWSHKGIWGHIRAVGKPLALKHKRVFDNCNLEFFLSPGIKRETYFQWVISALGQLHSGTRQMAPIAMAYDPHWRCQGFDFKVTRHDKDYVLDFFIPFEGLRVPPPKTYQCWLFSLVRNKRSAPAEVFASCLTRGLNHNVEQFAILKFTGRPWRNK